jgi:hypothetical protein
MGKGERRNKEETCKCKEILNIVARFLYRGAFLEREGPLDPNGQFLEEEAGTSPVEPM